MKANSRIQDLPQRNSWYDYHICINCYFLVKKRNICTEYIDAMYTSRLISKTMACAFIIFTCSSAAFKRSGKQLRELSMLFVPRDFSRNSSSYSSHISIDVCCYRRKRKTVKEHINARLASRLSLKQWHVQSSYIYKFSYFKKKRNIAKGVINARLLSRHLTKQYLV